MNVPVEIGESGGRVGILGASFLLRFGLKVEGSPCMSLSRRLPPPRVFFVFFLLACAAPVRAQVQIADTLLVDLDAKDASAGEPVWANVSPDAIGDFVEVGDPF